MWKQSIFSKTFHRYLCAGSQSTAPDEVIAPILLALAREGSLFIACSEQQRTIIDTPEADHDTHLLNAMMAGCICPACQRGETARCSAR